MSNLTRPLTVVRRRPNLLDLLIPKDANTQGYRLSAATAFDGSFTTILTADISSGYLDRNLVLAQKDQTLQALNNRNHVRVAFDPQTFNGTAGLVDSQGFWLKYTPVDFAGTPGTASAPMLILPEEKLRGDSVIVVTGTAPVGASVAASQVLLLPFRSQDLQIRNYDSANSLFVAAEAGGDEVEIPGNSVTLSQITLPAGAQGCLLVRGGGGTAKFSAVFTSFLPL